MKNSWSKRTFTYRPPLERFWEKVNKNGPIPTHMQHLGNCWEWQAFIFPGGYGQFRLNNEKNLSSHRASYLLNIGEIPEKRLVCHKCDNRKCVRPDHLFLGTPKDNMVDCAKKGRTLKGENHPTKKRDPIWIRKGNDHHSARTPEVVARGECHGNHILTEEQVREIRKKYIPRVYSTYRLAREYNVDRSTISYITAGKHWKHVK